MNKELFGFISLAFAIASYLPYIWSTWKGNTRPHMFTWIIWSLVMAIGSAGQYAGNAGPGYWATSISAISCVIISILAIRQGDRNITKGDIRIFLAAILAIPVWFMTDNPLNAIIIVTVVDLLGYIPTFRKSYIDPYKEMTTHYFITNFKHFFSFYAMTTYSITTMLYPSALLIANTVLIFTILTWRWQRQVRL